MQDSNNGLKGLTKDQKRANIGASIGQQMGKWSRLCSVPIYWGRIGSGGVSGPWPPSGVKRVIPLKVGKRMGSISKSGY